MNKYTVYGEEFVPKFSFPIKGKIKRKHLTQIDLSKSNKDLLKAQSEADFDLSNFVQKRIDKKVVFSGILEWSLNGLKYFVHQIQLEFATR